LRRPRASWSLGGEEPMRRNRILAAALSAALGAALYLALRPLLA
jgi:hypothetical protein